MDVEGGGQDEGREGGSVGLQGQGQDPAEEGSHLPWIDIGIGPP